MPSALFNAVRWNHETTIPTNSCPDQAPGMGHVDSDPRRIKSKVLDMEPIASSSSLPKKPPQEPEQVTSRPHQAAPERVFFWVRLWSVLVSGAKQVVTLLRAWLGKIYRWFVVPQMQTCQAAAQEVARCYPRARDGLLRVIGSLWQCFLVAPINRFVLNPLTNYAIACGLQGAKSYVANMAQEKMNSILHSPWCQKPLGMAKLVWIFATDYFWQPLYQHMFSYIQRVAQGFTSWSFLGALWRRKLNKD